MLLNGYELAMLLPSGRVEVEEEDPAAELAEDEALFSSDMVMVREGNQDVRKGGKGER